MDDAPPVTAGTDASTRAGARRGPAGWIALAVLGGLLVVWGVGTVVGPGLTTTDLRTSYVAGVRDVVVDVDAGSVTLRGGSGSQVGVRTTRTWVWGAPASERSLVDEVLTVVGRCPEIGIGCRIDEELTIPHGVTVRVVIGAGSVTVTGLDVPVLDLESRAGSVRVVEVTAARLDVRSRSGGVRVSFLRPPAVARVESGAGEIDLTVPRGRYRVDGQSPSGVELVDVTDDADAARLLVAHSESGRVTIRSR